MKTFAILGCALCLAGSQGFARTIGGKLMDDTCYNSNRVQTEENGHKTYSDITKLCAPSASTTNFVVRVTSGPWGEDNGSTIMLGETGNSMAAEAMRSGTLQPNKNGEVRVRVTGKLIPSELFRTESLDAGRRGVASKEK